MSDLLSTVIVGKDARETAEHFTSWVASLAADSVASSGRFAIALSGGRAPTAFYPLWTDPDGMELHDRQWSVYFADERAVPRDHEASNAKLALDGFLSASRVPPDAIHPMPGSVRPLESAAREYEELLARELPLSDEGVPIFDCIQLGIGPDGHTASLFPDTSALDETKRFVVPNLAPDEPKERLTLTFPVLCSAKNVGFFVLGADKGPALAATARRASPASRVVPRDGELVWFMDSEAYDAMERALH